MVKNKMKDASNKITNHSLHVTGTWMLEYLKLSSKSEVDTALLKALGIYERVTRDQDLAISQILHSFS